MSDTTQGSGAPPTPEPAPAPVAPVEPVAPAPQPTEQPAPQPVETPQPAETDTPESEKTATTLHTDTPTLLQTATAEEKPAEGEKKPETEAKPAEPAPPERTYEPFKLPEGVAVDQERMTAFTGVLGKHNLSQEQGQELLDLHATAMQQFAEHQLAEQHRIFGETRAAWRAEVMADDYLGGSGHHTAMAAIARARDRLVPSIQRAEFDQFLLATGAGDHPAFLRLLHNAARLIDEPAAPPAAAKPPANIGRPPGREGRRGIIYDHPRSQRDAS